MKNLNSVSFFPRILSGMMLVSLLSSAFVTSTVAFAENTVQTVSSDAEYEFFVGIDVRIACANVDLPMVDFRDNNVILWSRGKPVALNYDKIKALRFFRSPKLCRNTVEIANFEAKGVVSNLSESEYVMDSMILMGIADDARDVAMGSRGISHVCGNTGKSNSSLSKIYSSSGQACDNFLTKGNLSYKRNPSSSNDAIDIRYTVSAKKTIVDAYAVIMAVIDDNETDRNIRKWICFQRLGQIDDRPKDFQFTQCGLPAGFELIGSQVFIFANGEEIANSMSDMRAKVSAQEARQLINACYIDAHKGMSLNPLLATTSIPDEVVAQLKNVGVSKPVTLHLGKDACVTSAGCDNKAVSEEALNLLKTLIFHPALKNGEPVEATIVIDVGQFSEKNLKMLAKQ